jgi:hypothetical protein
MLVQLLLSYRLITLRYIWMVAIFSEWVVVVKRKISTYWATKRLNQVIKSELSIWFKYPNSDRRPLWMISTEKHRPIILFLCRGAEYTSNNHVCLQAYGVRQFSMYLIRFVYTYCINVNMILINKTTWTKNHCILHDIFFSNWSLTFNKYRGNHKI